MPFDNSRRGLNPAYYCNNRPPVYTGTVVKTILHLNVLPDVARWYKNKKAKSGPASWSQII